MKCIGAAAARATLIPLVLAGMTVVTSGCGGTSATVLERLDAATPPGSTLRMDVFLLRSVSTCAVGFPCTRDLSQCFYLADATGPRIAFAEAGMRFVPPGSPETMTASQVGCFELVLDDDAVTAARALIGDLSAQVFNASGQDINIDVRYHDVPTLDAAFSMFDIGPFLEPSAVEPMGLSKVNRETDFVYAITGYRGADLNALAPRMDHCAGTNWASQGLFGGSTYTWLAMSDRCAQVDTFFSSWLFQFYFGKRELSGIPDLYADGYPRCGQGDPDPTRWFPRVEYCTLDPDWSACGRASCPDPVGYFRHVIEKHWPRGVPFNGNYCSNGRMDTETRETGVDVGGVCDLLGR